MKSRIHYTKAKFTIGDGSTAERGYPEYESLSSARWKSLLYSDLYNKGSSGVEDCVLEH